MPHHNLTDLLGIQYPIIQAPMAGGITTPGLVIAVSEAGGLGSFGAAYTKPADLRQAIKEVKARTDKPFQVNLFVPNESAAYHPENHQPALAHLQSVYEHYGVDFSLASATASQAFEEQFSVAIEEGVPIISFTFGIPDENMIRQVKEAERILMGTATCVEEAKQLEKAGFDLIVAQGYEAGGHRATFHSTLETYDSIPNIGLFALIPQLVNVTSLPVIASGGITSGQGVLAALILGAAGAQLGTAFMHCREANVTASWRKAMLESTDASTTLTKAFSGRCARGVTNDFMRNMQAVEHAVPPFPFQNSLTSPLRAAAKSRDDVHHQSLWAGQTANLSRAMSAHNLLTVLIQEWSETKIARP